MAFHIQDTDTVRVRKRQSLTSERPTRKMTGIVFLFLGVFIEVNISSSKALRLCYSCHAAASSGDCDKIVKCGYHEECFEQMVVSDLTVLYTSGCIPKVSCTPINSPRPNPSTIMLGKRQVKIACTKCCDSDFCNVGLCGEGTPTLLQCISCAESYTIFDCDHIEQCSPDAMCYAHKRQRSGDLMPRYQTGCLPKAQCEAIAHAVVVNQCYECCDTHMCNIQKCGLNWTAVYHTTPHPASTVTITTPTTTTQLYPPVITGLTSLEYHGSGGFNCMSTAHDVIYTWQFNGGSLLAPHAYSNRNVMEIRNMTELEVGTYTCILSKSGATAKAFIQVTIKEAPAHVVSVSSSPLPAVSGKELNLRCNVTGYPVPEIYWSFRNPNGMCVIPPNVIFAKNDNAYISSYKPESNRGNWTCIAINKHATDTLDTVVN